MFKRIYKYIEGEFMLKRIMVLATCLLCLAACNKDPEQITLHGKTMGTTYNIKYIDDKKINNLPSPEAIQQQLENLLNVVNNEMSTYQQDSQISQFNKMHEVDKAFPISADFLSVVNESIKINRQTEGALDITVGPLVNLWGFGPDRYLNRVPTEAQIAEKSQSVGIQKLEVQSSPQPALIKKHPQVYIDLSSIAKGFGIDKLSGHLELLGIENYLVEIGGDLRTKGKNLYGEFWHIAIEKPEFVQGTTSQLVVAMDNMGMATSGNYRNYFEDDKGNRLSHIIDPKALHPIRHNLASLTVIAPSAMTADGLATGLYVLGADKALAIAERENLAIFLILKNGNAYETKMSSAFQHLIQQK